MGSLVREWVGFQQFPAATQERLIEFFTKLKQKVSSFLKKIVSLHFLKIFFKGLCNFAGYELIDSCCNGQRRCGKIIHCQLSYW